MNQCVNPSLEGQPLNQTSVPYSFTLWFPGAGRSVQGRGRQVELGMEEEEFRPWQGVLPFLG